MIRSSSLDILSAEYISTISRVSIGGQQKLAAPGGMRAPGTAKRSEERLGGAAAGVAERLDQRVRGSGAGGEDDGALLRLGGRQAGRTPGLVAADHVGRAGQAQVLQRGGGQTGGVALVADHDRPQVVARHPGQPGVAV